MQPSQTRHQIFIVLMMTSITVIQIKQGGFFLTFLEVVSSGKKTSWTGALEEYPSQQDRNECFSEGYSSCSVGVRTRPNSKEASYTI